MNHLVITCELTGLAVGAANAVSGGVADWVELLALVTVIVYGRSTVPRSNLPFHHTEEVKIVSIVINGGGEGSTDDPRNH